MFVFRHPASLFSGSVRAGSLVSTHLAVSARDQFNTEMSDSFASCAAKAEPAHERAEIVKHELKTSHRSLDRTEQTRFLISKLR